MKPATHSGHCQACGRLQKLPGGVLSKHGYNVVYGFFSGVCVGAAHKPFELDCSLVERFIVSAKQRLAEIKNTQRALRAESTDSRAWVREYDYAARKFASYRWVQATVEKSGESRFTYASDPIVRGRLDTFDLYAQGHLYGLVGRLSDMTATQVATHLNRRRADWLEHEADSLRRYIRWQSERVASWAPEPLLPVTHKDKAGFVPTAPKY